VSQRIWINGETVPMDEARIRVEDRGFQFADGVYEVVRVYNNKPFTLDLHLDRLARSAAGVKLTVPVAREELAKHIRQFITNTKPGDSYLYLQLTRGVATRNHRFPADIRPTLLFYTHELPPAPVPGEGEGVKLLAVEDDRWKRCWIKSIALVANVLAKNEAVEKGYDEPAFVVDGIVTEGATSNVFAVIGNKLITHPIGSKVLPGITRQLVFDCATKLGVEIHERPFREEEAKRADELFITSTTRELGWVARYNDRYIGQGRCGPLTIRLHRVYRDRVLSECG